MTAAEVARRTRARRGEGDKLRKEILEAAERLLVATGDSEAVSIRAVAEAVGVTSPSIYLHFEDKNELLFSVCEKHFAELDAACRAASEGVQDPVEALRLRGRAYVRFGLDHPEAYRILFMSKPTSEPPTFDPQRFMRMAAFDNHVDAVRRCVEAGAIEGDPVMVAIALWAGVHGITSLLIAKPNFPWPDRDALIDQVLMTQMTGALSR